MKQKALSREDVTTIISNVTFMDRKFILHNKGDGFLVQMEYMEEDVDNPDAGLCVQKTRKWYISPFMTESEIVETCWAMVCRSALHIAGEHFEYKGARVYSPHFDINARIELANQKAFDSRIPLDIK